MRLRDILVRHGDSKDWNTGISALIEAQGPIKKNQILGLPRLPANSVIEALNIKKQTRRTNRIRSNNKSSNAGGSGVRPSRSAPRLPHEILTKLIESTLNRLRSDPSIDKSTHPSPQQLHILTQELINGSDLNSSSQVNKLMQTEMVHLMVSIFEDVLRDILHNP